MLMVAYIKAQKNDASDAERISKAASPPKTRFVEVNALIYQTDVNCKPVEKSLHWRAIIKRDEG